MVLMWDAVSVGDRELIVRLVSSTLHPSNLAIRRSFHRSVALPELPPNPPKHRLLGFSAEPLSYAELVRSFARRCNLQVIFKLRAVQAEDSGGQQCLRVYFYSGYLSSSRSRGWRARLRCRYRGISNHE
jgi:hypothetical protein